MMTVGVMIKMRMKTAANCKPLGMTPEGVGISEVVLKSRRVPEVLGVFLQWAWVRG